MKNLENFWKLTRHRGFEGQRQVSESLEGPTTRVAGVLPSRMRSAEFGIGLFLKPWIASNVSKILGVSHPYFSYTKRFLT